MIQPGDRIQAEITSVNFRVAKVHERKQRLDGWIETTIEVKIPNSRISGDVRRVPFVFTIPVGALKLEDGDGGA